METNKNMAAHMAAEKKETFEVKYESAGQDITLNAKIVRQYLTKGNSSVTDQEILQFISICKYNKLNPFLNEAYLVKFDGKDGGNAQMIVSKEALFKRAEANINYDGFQAGIIVLQNGEIKELEGTFIPPEAALVGGWAKVYRSDRKYPVLSRVNLEDYDQKRSIWNGKKATMIAKVAKMQALREAFPAQLGAMYTAEEQDVEDVPFEEVKERQVEREISSRANYVPLPAEAIDATVEQEEKTTEPAPSVQPIGAQPVPSIFN